MRDQPVPTAADRKVGRVSAFYPKMVEESKAYYDAAATAHRAPGPSDLRRRNRT